MIEAKHTPGPWKAGRPDMATYVDGWPSKWIYGGIDQSKYVAVASGKDIPDWKEVMANAHLIAAAPEMLDELEKQRNKHCFASSGVGNCDTCRDKQNCSLLRVINKAKGVRG